jgi:hypothetical protein
VEETTQPDDRYSSRVDEPEAPVAEDKPFEDGWLHDEDDPSED